MRKKIFSVVLILILILSSFSFKVFANEKNNTSIKKVVSIVYDDSTSMNDANDNWAYASYSLQNLIGLMNSNDEIGIVKMSNPTQSISFNLNDNEERKLDIKSVENWKPIFNTPFKAVETAASWLKNKKIENDESLNVEYWLIVITDGQFNGYRSDIRNYLNEIKTSMGNSKYEGVFVAIGKDVPSIVKDDWKSVNGNHVITSSNSTDIVNAMSEVSGLILGQGGKSANIIPVISDDGKSITFDTILPLKKFIIFEQNQSISINSVLGNEVNGYVSADFSTSKPTNGSITSRIIHCEAMETEYFPTGKITVNFDSEIDIDTSKFKILAMPAVNVSLKIIDNMGNEINNLDKLSFTEGDIIQLSAVVTSSIDNSIIDLRNWNNSLNASLIANSQNIMMKYNKQDNKFYGKYTAEAGDNLVYSIVTLPGFFRAKSDVINIHSKEIVDDVSLNISNNVIDVPYKYISSYEEIAKMWYVVTGGSNISGIHDFEFLNIPKGITVSVSDMLVDEYGKVSLEVHNDVPVEVKIYRNKDYKDTVTSKIKINVTSKDYELEWVKDSVSEIVLNPVERNILIEEVKLDDADKLKLNKIDKQSIYRLSILGDGEYLSKEELETLVIEYNKIKGISLNKRVVEYNGMYVLDIYCEKELIELLIKTGDNKSSLGIKTIYNEESNKIDILFRIIDSFTKYILPILLLLLIIILIGYMPGIKKRINKNYCIKVNNEYEMIMVKPITKLIPYISEVGIGSDLMFVATSNSNRVSVINNFNQGQKIYIDNELIQDNVPKFDLVNESKLKIIDGHRETTYVYMDSRGNGILDNKIDDVEFDYDDKYFTNSKYNEDYY